MPEETDDNYAIDTLDIGDYAHVGILPTDSVDLPTGGRRRLTVTHVDGDHTATIHVEPFMWLNIEFNSSAKLTFHVTLYEVRCCEDFVENWIVATINQSTVHCVTYLNFIHYVTLVNEQHLEF